MLHNHCLLSRLWSLNMLSFPVCLQLAMMNTVKIGDGEISKPFKWKFNTANFWTALRISENYHAVQTIPAKYGFFSLVI